MLKLQNVFDDGQLQLIHEDLQKKLDSNSFVNLREEWSRFTEIPNNVNDYGSVTQCLVSTQIKQLVRQVIIKHYSHARFFDADIFYQIWGQNSYIKTHSDSGYAYSATLYLVKKWSVDSGGLFVYFDEKNDLQCVCPEYNMLIINTKKLQHLVTPITDLAEDVRYTIQVFGKQ